MRRLIRTFLAGTAAGVGLAYFMDPDRGRARRHRAVDQLNAIFRRGERQLEREGRYRAGQIEGAVHRLTHRTPEEIDVDDTTLKSRIESEVLTRQDFPGAEVNLTVVDGIVEIRGQLRTPGDINDLVRSVEKVPGVVGVRNFTHLPKTPAPNKQQAREAG